jgi:hypothetical protein
MNNYNECKDMGNIELHVCQDGDLARHYFEEEFHVIQHSGYRDRFIAEYLPGCGERQIYSVSDCYDLTIPTKAEFRQFVIKELECSHRAAWETIRYSHGTWKEYAIRLLNEKSWNEIAREGLPFIAKGCEVFSIEHVTGYSQGDYGYIFVPGDCPVKRSDLENLIYSAPVSISLEIDGETVDVYLDNPYDYSKQAAFDHISAQCPGLSEAALDWIEDNLPEYPEYNG